MDERLKEQAIKITLKNLMGLPEWKALEELRKWGDVELYALRDDIALPREYYEVCELAHRVLIEKQAKSEVK